ncbi:DoxX family protein [Humidisolicoccus flavus]|uniref:DoxX family protein n=1 Tax=Humidisolicoccus flavus TaxID=3111414 RepID=UPI003245F5C7
MTNTRRNTMRIIRHVSRVLLAAFLIVAGTSHLAWLREEFTAQVPPWLPLDADFVVLASGVVEIALGILLLVLRGRALAMHGWVVAAFFLVVVAGNISQFVTRTDAFGLNSDLARGIRLLFQPLLIAWALFSTRAIGWARTHLRDRRTREQNPGSAGR